MNILVSGCTGFIGSWLVKDLSEKKYQIYCLSKSIHKTDISTHIRHNFSSSFDCHNLPKKIDCIIHSAATMDKNLNEDKIFKINTLSTLDLLNYGKTAGVKVFVYLSSGGVYGYNNSPRNEYSEVNPLDFYALSKYSSELFVNYFSRYFSVVNLRIFFPYGPGQKNGIIPILINNIKNKIPITLYSANAPKINPIFISDLVNVIGKSLYWRGSHTLNMCGDEQISIRDLSMLIGEKLNIKPLFKHGKNAAISNLLGDNKLVREKFGLIPKVTLREGLEKL